MRVAWAYPRISAIKWGASLAQIAGYGATAAEWAPWNVYCFVVGIVGWFIVGWHWNDRAIMLIHIVALAVMTAGMLSA